MSIFDAVLELLGEISSNALVGSGSSRNRQPNFEYRPPGGGAIFISILTQFNNESEFPVRVKNALIRGLNRCLSKAGYVTTKIDSEEDFTAEENSYLLRVEQRYRPNEQDKSSNTEEVGEVISYELIWTDHVELLLEVPLNEILNGKERPNSRDAVVSLNKILYELRIPKSGE